MPIDKSTFPPIRADISVMHHPDTAACKWAVLDEDGTVDQHALMAGVSALRVVYLAQAEVNDARRELAEHAGGRPVMSVNGQVKLRHGMEAEYGAGVSRVKERCLKTLDTYTRQVAAYCDQFRERLEARLKDKTTTPALQAEIRAHIKSLEKGERLPFITRQSFQAWAAVMAAPAFLSGLSDDDWQMAAELGRKQHAKAEWERNEAVHQLNVHLFHVRDQFVQWADGEIAEASTPAARAANKVKALGR